MRLEQLINEWKLEEGEAHIHGWDFSHINGRYTEETDLPWNYKQIVRFYRKDTDRLLDIDTGGGEFLLSLRHPFENTYATEGYPSNAELCRKRLVPLGIHFCETVDYGNLPFKSGTFQLIINRHGDYCVDELYRLLAPGGIFITEQVGEENDRELVEQLLPGTPKPFQGHNLANQTRMFAEAGFKIRKKEEAFRPIRFFDIGALVWFAKIIEWEFPEFSVSRCLNQLLKTQEILEKKGSVDGTIHRYLIVSQK